MVLEVQSRLVGLLDRNSLICHYNRYDQNNQRYQNNLTLQTNQIYHYNLNNHCSRNILKYR